MPFDDQGREMQPTMIIMTTGNLFQLKLGKQGEMV